MKNFCKIFLKFCDTWLLALNGSANENSSFPFCALLKFLHAQDISPSALCACRFKSFAIRISSVRNFTLLAIRFRLFPTLKNAISGFKIKKFKVKIIKLCVIITPLWNPVILRKFQNVLKKYNGIFKWYDLSNLKLLKNWKYYEHWFSATIIKLCVIIELSVKL